MKIKLLYILLIYCNFLFAQKNNDSGIGDNEVKTPLFFGGINIGGLFPNNKTALIYTGANSITPYGIDYILNTPQYKTTFDTYFKFPYSVAELPQDPSYKAALNIGIHAGINVGKMAAIFVDVNTSQLKYEQVFSMEINDPNNQSPGGIFEQLPIIGEEKRFNLNLGTQLSLYNDSESNLYWSVFGNFNAVKLQKNYILINNIQYNILHTSNLQTNSQPGGIGYGVGSGIGFKYQIVQNIFIDFTYNLYYSKINMNENLQSFGIQNELIFRLLWSK